MIIKKLRKINVFFTFLKNFYCYYILSKKQDKIMQKLSIYLLALSTMSNTFCNESDALEKAPELTEKFNEIITTYDPLIPSLYNNLSSEERILMYYLFRANLPGNRIAADQFHRDSLTIIDIFETILKNEEKLQSLKNHDEFINQVKTFLVYLWSNHGQYFLREFTNHKRTFSKLNLDAINYESLKEAFDLLEDNETFLKLESVKESLFDDSKEPTLTVPGDINNSAINVYSKDFSEEDFDKIPFKEQKSINAYYCLENNTPTTKLYKIGGKYDKELKVSLYWMNKAYEHAKNNPKYFDKHFSKSLLYLMDFIKSGDEEDFKNHSKEWLNTNSRIDYVWGFIETYKDPKSYTGFFEAETTIKYIDMTKLKNLLPSIEERLPFPKEFKRSKDNTFLPNVSINVQTIGTGDNGPMRNVAAYCLPNYDEIRSTLGSKQIIYPAATSLGQKLNKDLYKKLFYLSDEVSWYEENDPEFILPKEIWILHVLLHETIGHGSGKFHEHTFKEGENLVIEGKKFNVGDKIKVTSENIQPLISPYSSTLEELRAEILALHASIEDYDDLINIGFFENFKDKISKDKMIELLIIDMCKTAIKKMPQQQDGVISGDHARANFTIMNYLIEKGAIKLIEEEKIHNDKTYVVLGFEVTDLEKAKNVILELANHVQYIKSTADGIACRELIEKYGINMVNMEHIKYQKENLKATIGNLKAQVDIYPYFSLIRDEISNEVIDAKATWPKDIFEQHMKYSELYLSTEE